MSTTIGSLLTKEQLKALQEMSAQAGLPEPAAPATPVCERRVIIVKATPPPVKDQWRGRGWRRERASQRVKQE
jgi:hypothetical protein